MYLQKKRECVCMCANRDSFINVIAKNLRAAIPCGRKLVREIQTKLFAKTNVNVSACVLLFHIVANSSAR